MNKKVAISYKGKHFIIQDEPEEFDYVLEYIDVDAIIASDRLLENHISDCIYYGIPAYTGKDKVLHERIDKIKKSYEQPN